MTAVIAPKTILLAEDEVFIRELYDRVLTQEGFRVICAVDGEDAMSKLHENPDLILLDIMMPKMNGIEVLKNLKSNPSSKNIPVVLVTNLGAEKIIREAYALGAQGYMMKMRNDPYIILENVKKFINDPHYIMQLSNFDIG